MNYYLRWTIWMLKKKQVQAGLIAAVMITIVSLVGVFIASRADLLTAKSDYDNCVKMGMDNGRKYFQAVCEANENCDKTEFSEVEMDGFLQFAESVRIECERMYRK